MFAPMPIRACLHLVLVTLTLWVALAPDADAQSRRRRVRLAEDSIPISDNVPTIIVASEAPTAAERRRHLERVAGYSRLRNNVRKMYPLAKEVAAIANKTEAMLASMPDEQARRQYVRQLERELFRKYEPTLRNMTRSQGKLLIRLVYRQTGRTCFQLVEQLRSEGSADFWQMLSRIYGADLKQKYDPAESPAIEMIIQQIENGENDDYQITVTQ
jgi:hypothetical protein